LHIERFVPPKFERKPLGIVELNLMTGKSWHYSASGRASIYQILKPLSISRVLIPVYVCPSLLIPLRKLDIIPIFYDIDQVDLNPSLESIQRLSRLHHVEAVVVPSLYGNPADLAAIEAYCKEQNIFMIDDAAQSFGATLDSRFVGTFGDAGFFSLSPGKATAGHMGSFFWSDLPITIQRARHCFIHYLKWLDFRINRYEVYTHYSSGVRKGLDLLSRIAQKYFFLYNDDICPFETDILGGIIYDALGTHLKFRKQFFDFLEQELAVTQSFKIVKAVRGSAHPHKFVLQFSTSNAAVNFIHFLMKKKIYASNGYKNLFFEEETLPIAGVLSGTIVEIPIEDNTEKMAYLSKTIQAFK
jgi:dTDP-4-amino-4,6-dideoxygalactose transaminase